MLFKFSENPTSADLDFQLLTSILTYDNEKSSILTTNINNREHDALQMLVKLKNCLKDGETKRMTTETLNRHCLVTSEVLIKQYKISKICQSK